MEDQEFYELMTAQNIECTCCNKLINFDYIVKLKNVYYCDECFNENWKIEFLIDKSITPTLEELSELTKPQLKQFFESRNLTWIEFLDDYKTRLQPLNRSQHEALHTIFDNFFQIDIKFKLQKLIQFVKNLNLKNCKLKKIKKWKKHLIT